MFYKSGNNQLAKHIGENQYKLHTFYNRKVSIEITQFYDWFEKISKHEYDELIKEYKSLSFG